MKKLRARKKNYSVGFVSEVLEHWKLETTELCDSLNQLLDEYLKTGTKNKHGLSAVNAVGQPFNTTKRKTKNGEWKKWRRDVMRRKLLAHMIQGLESRAVYDYVSSHNGVVALEHDGFVSLHELSDGNWKHLYLEIVLHPCIIGVWDSKLCVSVIVLSVLTY